MGDPMHARPPSGTGWRAVGALLLAGAGCAADPDDRFSVAQVTWVELPSPPENVVASTRGHVAPSPQRLSFFDVEVGDPVSDVAARLGRNPTDVPRSTFESFYSSASYRDLGTDMALALGFSRVDIFSDERGVLLRAYVNEDGTIRMMSFVAATMSDRKYSVRLSRDCRIGHAFEGIESACGQGFDTIENPVYPNAWHFFARGFSVVASDGRIAELHVYGRLTKDEMQAVRSAIRAPAR